MGLPPPGTTPAAPTIHEMQTRFSLAANTVKSLNQTTLGSTWKNHGQYVSSVAQAAEAFLAQGLISQA